MSAAHNRESFSERALGFDYSASTSETDKMLYSTGSSLSQQYSQTGLSANQMTGLLAIGAGLAGRGRSRSRSAISGELSGKLQNQYQVSDQLAERVADDIATRVTSDTGFQSSLASSVNADAQQGLRSVFTQGIST